MRNILLNILLLSSLVPMTAFPQGSLTPPPGVPAPTMKTLDQIEARTPIPKTIGFPDPGPHYTISQPGSYYLTGNVEVFSGHGIVITSSNVTLDLNGFALISKMEEPAAGHAISLGNDVTGIIIKNGTITGGAARTPGGGNPWDAAFVNKGWASGIQDVSANPAMGVQVSDVAIVSCRSAGISLSGSCQIHRVTATANGGTGISVKNANVSHSSATQNGGTGITVFTGTVSHAFVMHNSNWGIYCTEGAVANATAKANGSIGIETFSGVVSECQSLGNFKSGIYVGTGVAAHCVASGNSTDPSTTDKNIHVFASGQRVGCVPATE